MIPRFSLVWATFVILPLVIVVFYSFFTIKNYQVVYEPTFATWVSLIESGRWIAALRTLRVVFTITVIEFLIAFPFALWLAKGCRSKTLKAVVITLLTIPFFLDAPSRIIIWRAILGTNGIINTVLLHLGLIEQPMEWMLFSGVRGPFRHDRALLPDHGVPDLPGPDPDRRRVHPGRATTSARARARR